MQANSDSHHVITDEEKIALQQFRVRVEDLNPKFKDFYLLKWLRARRLSIPKAEKMLRDHYRLRKNLDLDKDPENEFPIPEIYAKYSPHGFLGFDDDGDIIVVCLIGIFDAKGIMSSTTFFEQIKVAIYMTENAIRIMQKENIKTGKMGDRINVIYDVNELKLSYVMDRTIVRNTVLQFLMLEANYPEILKRLYFINAPAYYIATYNMMKRFFDARPLSKVKVFGKDGWQKELLDVVGADNLFACWGGKRTDPDGNTECQTLITRKTKVPPSYFLKNPKAPWIDNATEIVVRERSSHDHVVDVNEANCTIQWIFYTVDCNIGFAVYHIPTHSTSNNDDTSSTTEKNKNVVIPLERINTQYTAEKDEMHCKEVGKYILHFDNTFSWLTPKDLYLRVEVKYPNVEKGDNFI